MKEFELNGRFWLPGKQDGQIGGRLLFRGGSNDPELTVYGAFGSPYGLIGEYYPLILGVADNGVLLTLSHCSRRNFTMSVPGAVTSIYHVSVVYNGAWVESEEELCFNRAYFNFSYLYDWVGQTGFSQEFAGSPVDGVTIKYSKPQPIPVSISLGTVSLLFGVESESKIASKAVQERTTVRLESKTPLRFWELMNEFAQPFKLLLNLATTKPNYVESLHVYRPDKPNELIEVVYAQRFYQSREQRQLRENHQLFTYKDVADDYQEFLGCWMEVDKELREALLLFHRVQSTPDLFLELKLLSITQALETFHRRRRNGHAEDKAVHKQRINEILACVPEVHKPWLTEALAFSNEKRLVDRLLELINESFAVMERLPDNVSEFAKYVKVTRNYLTHYDPRLKAKAAEGADLHWMIETLIVLLQASLLNELGVDPEIAESLFQRNDYYKHLASVRIKSSNKIDSLEA